ncbi:phenylacetate--CoA ligase family protein [Chromobacterium aquaticum]|uniref:Phenylacetate--CoA ligase family protein n=2 Tax=Chromobacterium aquaticum TaxID=467180 RepID=A0ABV8ZW04_9NEIS
MKAAMDVRLRRLVEHARAHSPFFTALYRELPADWTLSDLPLIEPADYWRQCQPLEDWPVLSGPLADGHVFKTGGSTSDGKLSVFRRDEWQAFVRAFGQGLGRQLLPGDRVANLFFAGDLYTSLLFIHGALSHSPAPVVEFPFTCNVEDAALADAIDTLDINVLAGVPVQLVRFASWLQQAGRALTGVRCLLYGGESLFAEQLALLGRVFPNARIGSIGCASVDAGLIGAAGPDCAQGEHRVFDADTIVEIIDEASGLPITEPDRKGLLVVSNLQRRLMPVIRYPTGDLACWREPAGRPERKFALQGRASRGHRVRVCTLSLFPDELDPLLRGQDGVLAWQLLVGRRDGVDTLSLRVASEYAPAPAAEPLRERLLTAQPALAELCRQGLLRLDVAYCAPEAMLTHPRSGKLMRVVDQRAYEEVAA